MRNSNAKNGLLNPVQTKRKKQVSGIAILSIAIAATSVAGYAGWKYYQKRRRSNTNVDFRKGFPTENVLDPLPTFPTTNSNVPTGNNSPVPTQPIPNNPTGANPYSSVFPLKKGSKGEKVRRLQASLIAKHGRQILPKYGADGGFGAETVNALTKLKLPATISETLFNVLVQPESSASATSNFSALGRELHAAAVKKDFNSVISKLGRIKNPDEYRLVSDSFKLNRLGAVRQTLVTGLLNVFSTPTQKELLRLAFARIGLSYDGQRWNIPGINGIPIITVRPSQIWINPRRPIRVPSRTILGHEVARRQGYVVFSNKGQCFLVEEHCIRHI